MAKKKAEVYVVVYRGFDGDQFADLCDSKDEAERSIDSLDSEDYEEVRVIKGVELEVERNTRIKE